ncbi:hypothetical protein MOMUL_13780 [Moorella mulderi DSM 14980]|uniref:Uncharacterized protein n=2 Tax=Neomoorella TaxID=44260 RepID=A0A151AYR2_9FIRM|nr:hypothetical protein MOMUL_13780 [Moorella mulderi DSM 14980]
MLIMDEEDMKTGLTEGDIRQLAGEQSFKRGMNYYTMGTIREPFRQGAQLWGKCYGSQDELYRVKIVLGENGIGCVDGLSECLDEGDYDNDTRQVWLATLMEVELADIKLGGIGLAPGAFDIIIEQATEEEWPLLEERVRRPAVAVGKITVQARQAEITEGAAIKLQ